MSVLKEKSFLLAIEVVRIYKHLVEEKKEYVMSKQLLRSGTSVGAMVRESQNAESKMDFVHKLGIAQECDETLYWLELLQASGFLNEDKLQGCYQHTSEVLKILKSVILTTKHNLKKKTIHNP